ncbi:POT family-domain-containing protein [Xylariales sp. PMI_506]|nr:POT family-domain-containing protein [Xylariales sp. PMI_506]
MEFPLPEGGPGSGAVAKDDPDGTAGALGKGLQFASALGLLFIFMSYVFPLFGAYIADTKLGRYKTIMLGVIIGGIAHIIMVGGAAPSLLKANKGVAPFMISFFLLAIGAGIFKPNVAPTVLDQYTHQKPYVRVLKSGERVLVDPETTIQRIMTIYYGFVNVGAFFEIASTYAEKYVGYWLAFLIPGILYILVPFFFLAVQKKIIKKPPKGSELTDFIKITWTSLTASKFQFWRKDFWDAARPQTLAAKGITVRYPNRLVTDVSRTWEACAIFLYFPIYYSNDGGIGAVSSNQGASMTTNGAPNDLLNSFNPLVICVFTPIVAYGLYPLLNRFGIRFGRIKRITFGFLLCAISGICGGLVQLYVYRTSPCGYYASTCDGVSPISIWWQVPNTALGAISEIFANVTSYELAYARAPPNMKGAVMAICLFMSSLQAALGEILVPAIIDPHLVWVWIGPAIALFAQTAIFWVRHRHVDEDAFMVYESDEEPVIETAHLEQEKL